MQTKIHEPTQIVEVMLLSLIHISHDHYWIRYADDPSDLSYASLMQEMSKAVKAVPSATPSQRHIG